MQNVDKLFKMYGDAQCTEQKRDTVVDAKDLEAKDERIRMGLEDGNGLKFQSYRMECEVFNDSAFYRRMLKEIIDIGRAQEKEQEKLIKKMDKMQRDKTERKNLKVLRHIKEVAACLYEIELSP